MAIDGEISIVKTAGCCCFIHLRSSWHHDSWSIPGQRFLMIRDYTFRPRVGQIVWGSSTIFIEPGMGITKRHEYHRVSTLRMVEAEFYPETEQEIDDYLRRYGYDPDELGRRFAEIARRALDESPLNPKNRLGK